MIFVLENWKQMGPTLNNNNNEIKWSEEGGKKKYRQIITYVGGHPRKNLQEGDWRNTKVIILNWSTCRQVNQTGSVRLQGEVCVSS